MFVVVGLGNPGEKYERTRHNAGRMVLTHFLKHFGFPKMIHSAKCVGDISEGMVGDERVLVLFPDTYMNKSGSAVRNAISSNEGARKLIVVHDEIDLPLGVVRIVRDRGAGGHNGVSSIISALGTQEFVRVRVGIAPSSLIGRLFRPRDMSTYVLRNFGVIEFERVRNLGERVSAIIERIVIDGPETAMNEYN